VLKVEIRVTRLSGCLQWVVFYDRNSANLGLLFRKVCFNFDKNGLGYSLGDFFTNSFGHPSRELCTDGS
jgi:hypothetical protein